ncbi:hypothetical protein ABT010_01845 [Streptomyces sp. NPDC002668]|uniref:hypothetical protein n=1 Tax=Streptomyces sp. NPDC002668 TaxID=3154422 RepID=UPI003325A7F2
MPVRFALLGLVLAPVLVGAAEAGVNRVRTTAPPGPPGGAVAYPGDVLRPLFPRAPSAGQGAVK